jgi:hypothetical protein
MHRILLLFVLASAGCWGPTQTRGRVVGGTMATVGSYMLIRGVTMECPRTADLGEAISCGIAEDTAPYVGGALLAVGAAILAVNELRTLSPEHAGAEPVAPLSPPVNAAPAVPADPVPRPEVDDPMLHRLTLQASVAARAGSCSAVAAIASRVARLDPDYRQGGFQRDEKIAACLRG